MMHSPAPWTTDPEYGHEVVLDAKGVMVADCAILHRHRLGDTNKINARLVSAAPAMLTALRLVTGLYGDDWTTAERAVAEAAIAAAEGRAQ